MIKLGDRGDEVRDLQRRLVRLGFGPLDLDGRYGPASASALRLYQAAEGLAADGVCGPKTWAALRQEESPPSARYPGIIHALEAKGYSVHHDGQINIVGVRMPTRRANAFDDWIYLAWVEQGKWRYLKHSCTTDPGLYWLEEGRVDGTAIMVPGQYVDAYCWGKHRGTYTTLVNRGSPVKVFRDANGDDIVDMDPSTIETGWGLNLHHSGRRRARSGGSESGPEESKTVDRYSAGCIVWELYSEWMDAMRVCKASLAESFTFSLLTEEETKP